MNKEITPEMEQFLNNHLSATKTQLEDAINALFLIPLKKDDYDSFLKDNDCEDDIQLVFVIEKKSIEIVMKFVKIFGRYNLDPSYMICVDNKLATFLSISNDDLQSERKVIIL